MAHVLVRVEAASLALELPGGRRQRIGLTVTPSAVGGSRMWMCCPDCSSRRLVLYIGPAGYLCTRCRPVSHRSHRLSAVDRARDRYDKIVARLGGDDFAKRPTWMRTKTFEALLTEAFRLEAIIDNNHPGCIDVPGLHRTRTRI